MRGGNSVRGSQGECISESRSIDETGHDEIFLIILLTKTPTTPMLNVKAQICIISNVGHLHFYGLSYVILCSSVKNIGSFEIVRLLCVADINAVVF